MTDDELLHRLEETPPEDWSPEELELLRARAQAEPRVREALAEQLILEQTLTRGLTQVRVTAEQVLARYDERRRAPRFLGSWLRMAAVGLLIVGIGGVWYVRSLRPIDDRPIVERPAEQKVEGPPTTSVKPKSGGPTPSATPQASPSATASVAAPPDPPPVAPASDADEPWTPMLAEPARTFDDFCFADRKLTRDVAGLQRWWKTLGGTPRSLGNDDRAGVHFGGPFQLRAPWSSDTALTLWMIEQQTPAFKLHVWSGEQGVTFERRHRPVEQWTAHVATKRPNEPLPDQVVYAGGDNDRARRTGEGLLDLRYREGRVYLSRGDILLLSAPLPSAPDALNIEGAIVLKGIGLARVTDLPKRWTDSVERLPSYVEYPQPVAWPALPAAQWTTDLPAGATFEPLGDEGGALTAVDTSKTAYASFPLPKDGLYDLVFELEAADESTGIYLGTPDGFPRFPVGLYEYKPGDNLIVLQGRPGEPKPRMRFDAQYAPIPSVAFPARLRMVCGAGIVKVYGTADGRSWGRIVEPFRSTDDNAAIVGIYCHPGKGKRSIRLTRVRGLNYLPADRDLVAAAPRVRDQGDYTNWLVQTLANDRDALHKSAAALLTRGTRYDVAKTLLAGLSSRSSAPPPLEDIPGEGRKPPEPDAAYDLESLAWASDAVEGAEALEWQNRYIESAADFRPANPKLPIDRFTFARRRWMESSLTSAGKLPVVPTQMVRDEVVALQRAGKWNELDRLCRELHFFGGKAETQDRRQPPREPIMSLVDWAAAQAERRRTVPDGMLPTPPQTAFKLEWRHPLIEQFGKEGYNVLAELETALQEKAYSDACRIITGVTAAQAVGLLPNAADSDLLVSLPGAVALAMRDHAELRNVMQREYGALAQLRLRQATADGDVDAVQALTTQFYGTVAAAQAQMWLGDRALAQGDAARAEGCYFAMRTELPAADRAAIDARIRMAAAMQGRSFGGAPTSAVTLGEWTLSPSDFERTIEELRKHAPETGSRSSTSVVDAGAQATSPIPPPSRFTLKSFAKFDGEFGKNPEQLPQQNIDYIGRQISSIHLEEKGNPGKILISNRFQVAAYSLADGKLAWRTGLGAEQGRAHQWPLVPMPPVVDEDRIYVRRLTARGPELAILDLRDGKVLKRTPNTDVIASDPLVLNDRILVVRLKVPQQDVLEAELAAYDLRGNFLSNRPLVQLRDYWRGELNAELYPAGDMLLVKIGGCVIGCNAAGELRWLRRLPWIPPSVVSWPVPPEMETERLVEGKFLINGTSGESYRIDVRTGALELYSAGESQLDTKPEDWISPAQTIVHGDDWFAVHESSFNYGRLWRPRMYWQSAAGGSTDAAWPAPWTKEHPAIGPIFTAAGRHFAFTAPDLKSPYREIIELIPGDSLASEAPDVKNGGLEREWRSLLPEPLRNTRPAAPWQLLQSRYDDKLWLENKMFLQDDCRLTLALSTVPAVWTRTVGLPSTAPKVLHLRTAAAGTEPWKLTVRVNDKTVHEGKIEPDKGADPKARWRDQRIDLKPYAGRTVQITLIHSPIAGTTKNPPPSLAGWQRMEIIDP